MPLIAHSSLDGRFQPFDVHAKNVAQLAAAYASEFQSQAQAYLLGLLHDAGKCSPAGQKRLYGDPARVEHAAASAEIFDDAARVRHNSFIKLLAYCAAGHHTGLPDGGIFADTEDMPTLQGKLKRQKKRNRDYAPYQQVLGETISEVPIIRLDCDQQHQGFSYTFWTRMLFSCLVDADYLDTEAFMNNTALRKSRGEPLSVLLDRLTEKLASFGIPFNTVGEKRKEVLENCLLAAESPRGLFMLTVPTGGGKTLSSLAFALKHALKNNLCRVIYTIPYTSIIEQTASIFREILGEENVLEHHAQVNYDSRGDEQPDPRVLATENWDAPIVVTTNVQFFESLFSNRTSRCRKLHNIANSVLIFDEAQMLPIDLLLPCVHAIEELVRNHRCTAVLCSATQPALRPLFSTAVPMREICASPGTLYDALRRVRFMRLGQLSDEDLLARMDHHHQVLCIVNTKVQAQALYEGLTGEGNYHLSTLMTPALRRHTLKEIRARLKAGLSCRVIATSLIEAGVDVDFPCVFRQEAGLDSDIQAAGRCNREGKTDPDDAIVYLFRSDDFYKKKQPHSLGLPIGIAQMVMDDYPDIGSPEAIHAYFSKLFAFSGDELDKQRIVQKLDDSISNGLSIPFAEVANCFHVIDSPTRTVLIPEDDTAVTLIAALESGRFSRELLRRAGQHAVSVYPNQYEALLGVGALTVLDEELAVLRDKALYTRETGLHIPCGGSGIIC
ncbi:MAG: CRISPR-associated helicase Cas3' [Clostridia bacterium]